MTKTDKMKKIVLMFCMALAAFGLAAQEPDSLALTAADSLYLELTSATVAAERPVVKVDKGALVYDLPRILEKTPADNAFEALSKLPGVIPQGDGFSVAGRGATVILDGKVSTLTSEQVNALLRSTPVSRIAKAEVIPNATAKYKVRGALINIVLNHDAEDRGKLLGEIYGTYAKEYYGNYLGRGSLLYTKGKFSTDLIYSYGFNQTHNEINTETRHRLNDGSVHNISENRLEDTREKSHQIRWGADYFLDDNHSVSLVYNGGLGESGTDFGATGTQVSTTRIDETKQLHNVRVDYTSPFGLSLGMEYTHYNKPSNQFLKSTFEAENWNIRTEERQTIDRWKAFVGQEHSLGKGFTGGDGNGRLDNRQGIVVQRKVNRVEDLTDALCVCRFCLDKESTVGSQRYCCSFQLFCRHSQLEHLVEESQRKGPISRATSHTSLHGDVLGKSNVHRGKGIPLRQLMVGTNHKILLGITVNGVPVHGEKAP